MAPIKRIYITDLFMISGKIHYAKSSGTVKGTFDDLSDDEKTKAFLQLLEYKIRLEQEQKQEEEREQDNFHELWQKLPSHQVKPERYTSSHPLRIAKFLEFYYRLCTIRTPAEVLVLGVEPEPNLMVVL